MSWKPGIKVRYVVNNWSPNNHEPKLGSIGIIRQYSKHDEYLVRVGKMNYYFKATELELVE